MLRRFVLAGALIAMSTGLAVAQVPMGVHLGHDKAPLTPDQIQRQREIDQAYKSATGKIPDHKSANDPWADVRPAPGPKSRKP